MEKMETNIIWQIAIVVHDIEKTARSYADIFGLPMPEIIWGGLPEDTKIQYKGEFTKAQHKMAFFKMGLMQLEIIEPNEEPSAWRDFLDKHGEGVHHVAFNVNDVNETINFFESRGMLLLQRGFFGDDSYNYIDAKEQLGLVLELSRKKK